MSFGGSDRPDHEYGPDPEPIIYVDQPPPGEPAPAKRVDAWTVMMGVIGGALLGTGLTLGILGATGVFEEPTIPTQPTLPPPPTLTIPPPTSQPPVTVDPGVTSDVAERAIPSIVAVEADGFIGISTGSGVVYGTDGYLITNHHVVDGADNLAVIFSDGGRYPAELIGSDPLTDIAVIRVERTDLIPIDFGSSGGLAVGEAAIAVGNPLALIGGPSVTSGIVSALNRSLDIDGETTLYGLIQTDAPITLGSSGGALLDSSARLIGITTAIAVSDVGAEGLGFAVPIDLVVGVANDLIETGEVAHARIGISGTTAFATDDGSEYPVGVTVTEFSSNSAYEAAGGQVNDVITAMNGDTITYLDEMLTRLRMHRAGEEMTFTVLRADIELDLVVILGRLEP